MGKNNMPDPSDYDKFRPWLIKYFLAGTRSNNVRLAEDLADKTIKNLFDAVRRETEQGGKIRNIFSYAKTIAYRRLSDYYEKKKRDPGSLDGLPRDLEPSKSNDPLMSLIKDEDAKRVRNALNSIKGRDRKIFILYRYGDMAQKDIAERFDITSNAVSQVIRRVKKKLAQILGKEETNG